MLFQEPEHWCVVNYYELNTRLGVPFEATNVSFFASFLLKHMIDFKSWWDTINKCMRLKLIFIVRFKYRRIHESEHSWSALPRRDIESKSRIVNKDVSTTYWKRYSPYNSSHCSFKLENLKVLKWCIVMDRWQSQMFPIRPFLSRYKCEINFMLFIDYPFLHFRVQIWVNCMAQVKLPL